MLTASDTAARDLRSAFEAATGSPRADHPGDLVEPGLTRRDDLAGLKLARTPSVLLEAATTRNPQEALAVTDPGRRQRAAQGVADGVRTYLAGVAGDPVPSPS